MIANRDIFFRSLKIDFKVSFVVFCNEVNKEYLCGYLSWNFLGLILL